MYDFCINGGGMVGAALALGLAKQQYRVAIIEPHLRILFLLRPFLGPKT